MGTFFDMNQGDYSIFFIIEPIFCIYKKDKPIDMTFFEYFNLIRHTYTPANPSLSYSVGTKTMETAVERRFNEMRPPFEDGNDD